MTLGCEAEPPRRDCLARVWLPSSLGHARIVGSWNGWTDPGIAAEPFDAAWWLARFYLPPGEYGYLIASDGERVIDLHNPLTTFADQTEVSLLMVADCSRPAIAWQQVTATELGELTLRGTFLAADQGEPLDPASVSAETRDGRALDISQAHPETGLVEARGTGFGRGRHTVTVSCADEAGVDAEPSRVAGWVAPSHTDWRDAVLYQIMVDRFRADGGAPLAPPATPGSRAGGTLAGVRDEIERGTFTELGVTALWLSPAYVNPTEPREGNDGHLYEAYHGYWPLESRAVDERIGGTAALDAVVRAAHDRGIRVLLDLVPNHVYEHNPLYLQHASDGWFTPACVCGQTECPWSSHIQTCWFTPYLPDLRFQHRDVMRTAVEDSAWWVHGFNLDGVRVDAVPMMPRAATRRIAHGLRTSTFPPTEAFLVGEVYTGPGSWGTDEMRYHLGPAGFDSLFDFPLMWALRNAVGAGTGSFATVEDTLRYGETTLAGSGAVLGLMLDNHDTPRFVSVAHGDGDGDPWQQPAAQPTDAEPYLRLQVALAMVFTLPGMPVLFQGDEVGLAGAGDPDCRRVYPAEESLSAEQRHVRDRVRELSRLRACSQALRRGDRIAAVVDSQAYGYVRGSTEPFPALILVSAAQTPTTVNLAAGTLPPGSYVDRFTGAQLALSASEDASMELAPLSVQILLRNDDPCL